MDDQNSLTDYGAELHLKMLEDAGMLPPFSHDVFHREWGRTRDNTASGNQWEPEDEHPRSGAV